MTKEADRVSVRLRFSLDVFLANETEYCLASASKFKQGATGPSAPHQAFTLKRHHSDRTASPAYR